MEYNIIQTLDDGERVTSSYAEIYHNDDYCAVKPETSKSSDTPEADFIEEEEDDDSENTIDEWVSPSDLLIGIIELKPPFTSKITRGKTHEGILAIGGQVLQEESDAFLKHVTQLLHDNDAAWGTILQLEKAAVEKKVQVIYGKILQDKSNIMKKEISIFYENTLKELENHIRTEIKSVLINAHASMISDLNKDIKLKLQKEKKILEAVLKKKYDAEVAKIRKYYNLLLSNELRRNRKLINKSIIERNDALNAFYKQVEAENVTSTMYVMCTERKKCKVKKFIMKNYQDIDITEKIAKLKEKDEIIEFFKNKAVGIADLNKEWEDKIDKILKLFLKFISFSLKLLPEQATFLLDLEKMVVLQLSEIQKKPKQPPILVSDENMFKFEEKKMEKVICDKDPFVIEGDSSITPPPKYGSRETLAPEVNLPFLRLQRQYVYAKCHKFEEIKAYLESQRCKCEDIPSKEPSHESVPIETKKSEPVITPVQKESSNELLVIDDIQRLQHCPVRQCQDWAKRLSFPDLNEYLDFTEENYKRVQAILGKQEQLDPVPQLIDPKSIINKKLQFSATTEPYHTVGTQYSSQEDIVLPNIECQCVKMDSVNKDAETSYKQNVPGSKSIDEIIRGRKISLLQLMSERPNLLKIFTDESFDFIL